MHLNSQLLFERHALSFFRDGQRVLEIGPDTAPSTYERLVEPSGYSNLRWQTADLDYGADSTILVEHQMANEYLLPFPDDTFDVIVSGQVLEHVRRVWAWFGEVARVCKPDGYVITICPVSWPYHEAPVDCWRIYPEGMRALCEEAGLEVVVSNFESLEPIPSRRTYPGPSFRWNEPPTSLSRLKDAARRAIGWPSPVSVDTFTVARKVLPARPADQER